MTGLLLKGSHSGYTTAFSRRLNLAPPSSLLPATAFGNSSTSLKWTISEVAITTYCTQKTAPWCKLLVRNFSFTCQPAMSQLYLQCFFTAVPAKNMLFPEQVLFSCPLCGSQGAAVPLCAWAGESLCVCSAAREGAAGSTSSRAGMQIERVFGPEAIPSPVLPAAVGLLLVEREHLLCSTHPVL